MLASRKPAVCSCRPALSEADSRRHQRGGERPQHAGEVTARPSVRRHLADRGPDLWPTAGRTGTDRAAATAAAAAAAALQCCRAVVRVCPLQRLGLHGAVKSRECGRRAGLPGSSMAARQRRRQSSAAAAAVSRNTERQSQPSRCAETAETARPGEMSSEVGKPGLGGPYGKGPQAPTGPTKCMQK